MLHTIILIMLLFENSLDIKIDKKITNLKII